MHIIIKDRCYCRAGYICPMHRAQGSRHETPEEMRRRHAMVSPGGASKALRCKVCKAPLTADADGKMFCPEDKKHSQN